MSEHPTSRGGRIGLDDAAAALCRRFVGWQCRLRQFAARHFDGRPTPGMQPTVILPDDGELGPITVLIVRHQPEESTAQFRHMVLKTHDPADRLFNALRYLQASYYLGSQQFSDLMTALFALGSSAAQRMRDAGRCTLLFEEGGESYRIPCTVRELDPEHPAFQATYWHNSLFNSAMPGVVTILGFLPDWADASAEPPLVFEAH